MRASLALLLALAACAPARSARDAAADDAPDPEVKAAYLTYRDALAPWGSWEPDPLHGVRWCPSRDADAWRTLTARGGIWLRDDTVGRSCWVPGLGAEASRVVVRVGVPPEPERPQGPSTAEQIGEVAEGAVKVVGAVAETLDTVGEIAHAVSPERPARSDEASTPNAGAR
jgi:hypothetical protein